MDGILKIFVCLQNYDPHVGGVKQTKIIIFYEEPERYQLIQPLIQLIQLAC